MYKNISYLTKNNQGNYKVVIPTLSNKAEQFAASELVLFIKKSIGAHLSIITDEKPNLDKFISVGRTKLLVNSNAMLCDCNLDGFTAKINGGNVLFNAMSDRGFIYAVYDFLEKYLGIRFLAPDQTIIPRRSKLILKGTTYTSVPAFAFRTYLSGAVFMDYADHLFTVRSRTSSPYVSKKQEYGGEVSIAGRNQTHNMARYVPFETWGEKYPNWYTDDPLKMFERSIDLTNGITDNGEVDESLNESVLKVAISEMKKEVIANPHAIYFTFEQEDGDGYYKSLRNSQHEEKFGRSGITIRFVNVLAREVQNWLNNGDDVPLGHKGRQINIVTFAYAYTSNAPIKRLGGKILPLHPTVVAEKNVIIRMAQTSNAYYSYMENGQDEHLKTFFQEWQVICNKFMFWGYDTDYGDYISYFPSIRRIKKAVTELKNYNFVFLLMQSAHNTRNNWQVNLKAYIYSKLLWDPTLDQKQLLNEYLQGYYGCAANYVYKVIELFENHYNNVMANSKLRLDTFWEGSKTPYVTLALLEEAFDLLDKAKACITSSKLSKNKKQTLTNRILGVQITPQWMLINNFTTLKPSQSFNSLRNQAKKFFALCQSSGVNQFSESVPIDALKRNFGLE